MGQVESKDGTRIAYERQGTGPAVILVGGGLDDGSENAPLAVELAKDFTVYNYARRGRGDSGDTSPYALEREIEDVEALIIETGGPAHLFGASSGGALVLEAAAAGLAIGKIAVYEVPYSVGDEAVQAWREYVKQLKAMLDEGRRSDALALFMRLAGSSEEDVAGAKGSSAWAASEAIAHTLAYDAACLGDGRPPVERLARITQPTLVLTGSAFAPHMGGLQPGFFADAADTIAQGAPHARRQTIEGQSHIAAPEILSPILTVFFA